MKKLLIFVLLAALVLPLVACGDNGDTSSAVFSTASKDSNDGADNGSEKSDTDSEDESSKAPAIPKYIANFLSIGAVDTKVNANSGNAIKLTGIDTALEYGAIVLYTPAGEDAIENSDEFAYAEFAYSETEFGYAISVFSESGFYEDLDELKVPEDGFVLAVHSRHTAIINKLKALTSDQTVFPHGLHLYTGADHVVKKAETAPEIDGKFNSSEWEKYFVENVNAQNRSWSYAQFETNNYYSTAAYYTAYDKDYIYLCVVVDSPYHYCPVSESDPNAMYKYECIQVKVSSESPDGEYLLANFDHVANGAAVKEGIVRSYGFAVNDEGNTVYYESGFTTEFTGKAKCTRDDASQKTVYEVAIPFAEFGITPEKDMKLGLTFSINSTNEEDVAKEIWKNITYRDGGGVIGRNDWSKIPVITLG